MRTVLVLAFFPWLSPTLAAEPQVFAPGVISGPAHDAAPAFAPDGNTVYFSRSNAQGSAILVSHRRGQGWSRPELAPFSGVWSDMEPTLTPDGRVLVFVSNRPTNPGGRPLDGRWGGRDYPGGGGNLWRVERHGDAFGEPTRLGAQVNRGTTIFAPALARDGSLLFMEPDSRTNRFRLMRSELRDDVYQEAQPLPFSDGTWSDVDPALSPDGAFVVFGSTRPPAASMDLFISFWRDGGWAQPVHLGPEVNSPGSDAEARLSPDGRTLYFSSERVLPVHYPRTRAAAAEDLERIAAWDNGNYNIWQVSLEPWLGALAPDGGR